MAFQVTRNQEIIIWQKTENIRYNWNVSFSSFQKFYDKSLITLGSSASEEGEEEREEEVEDYKR